MLEEIHAESLACKNSTLLLFSSQKSTFVGNLAVGQLLEGEVVRFISDHRFLINFKGFEVIAESEIALNPGQQIQTRVVQTHPQVVMALMTEGIPEQKILSLIRSYLPLRVDWGELVESFGNVLKDEKLYLLNMMVDRRLLEKVISSLSSLSFDSDKAGDGKMLKEFMEHSGLIYESKLKDILSFGKLLPKQCTEIFEKDFKGLLLALSRELEKSMERIDAYGNIDLKGKVEDLLKIVHSSIKRIELHQLINCLTAKNDQQLVFQIPLVFPEGIQTAELYIRRYPKGKGRKTNKDDCQIVFLLRMRGLGELRIDTHLVKKKIRCTIQADSREIVNFVSRHIAELRNRFESLNYEIEKIACVVRKENMRHDLPLQGFSLFEMKLVDVFV